MRKKAGGMYIPRYTGEESKPVDVAMQRPAMVVLSRPRDGTWLLCGRGGG